MAPEVLAEAQPGMYNDSYDELDRQDALAAENQQQQEEEIFGEVQEYEDLLMSEIQASCRNYQTTVGGHIRMAATVYPSTSQDRLCEGLRGIIRSMKICRPDGKHTK